jgi:hypothetical protein
MFKVAETLKVLISIDRSIDLDAYDVDERKGCSLKLGLAEMALARSFEIPSATLFEIHTCTHN